jgi:hypothetical protein
MPPAVTSAGAGHPTAEVFACTPGSPGEAGSRCLGVYMPADGRPRRRTGSPAGYLGRRGPSLGMAAGVPGDLRRGSDDAFGERPLLAPPAWRFPGMSRWQGLLSAAAECLA